MMDKEGEVVKCLVKRKFTVFIIPGVKFKSVDKN